jgi:NAD-dependent dihydropyrimidine dehydrogenase PreA subunit
MNRVRKRMNSSSASVRGVSVIKEMSEKTPEGGTMSDWRGIPREKIPWFPIIDSTKCTSCRTCVEFCRNEVLEVASGEQKIRVRSPYNCVVECSTCGRLCPREAISFPDQKEFTDSIRTLLRQYQRNQV